MTKKNIQVIFAILLLTLLSVGGLYYFSQQSKETSAPSSVEPSESEIPTRESQIRDVQFMDAQTSAKILLSEITSKNYRVRLFEAGNGFSIIFPNTTMALAQQEFITPHPWIYSVAFEEKVFRGQNSVEMTVSTIDGIALFDQFEASRLTIELQTSSTAMGSVEKPKDTAAVVDTPKSTAPKEVAPKKETPKAAPKKTTTASKPAPKKTTPAPTVSKAPAPKPVVPEPDDSWSGFSDSNVAIGDEFDTPSTSTLGGGGFDSNAGNNFEDISPFNETQSFGSNFDDSWDTGSMSPISDAELSVMDLETGFSLGDFGDSGSSDGQVAAIPQDDGKFDMGTSAQVSMVRSMNVQALPNGRTSVVFDRESKIPFKIFRMVNPSRIVVDFKDAKAGFEEKSANLAGTSISRIETMKFEGNDGALLRVIMYMSKDPDYVSKREGNQLILELP